MGFYIPKIIEFFIKIYKQHIIAGKLLVRGKYAEERHKKESICTIKISTDTFFLSSYNQTHCGFESAEGCTGFIAAI